MWLRTEGPDGRQHVVLNAEAHAHKFRACRCNPRHVQGVIVHRVLNRRAMFTTERGGH